MLVNKAVHCGMKTLPFAVQGLISSAEVVEHDIPLPDQSQHGASEHLPSPSPSGAPGLCPCTPIPKWSSSITSDRAVKAHAATWAFRSWSRGEGVLKPCCPLQCCSPLVGKLWFVEGNARARDSKQALLVRR